MKEIFLNGSSCLRPSLVRKILAIAFLVLLVGLISNQSLQQAVLAQIPASSLTPFLEESSNNLEPVNTSSPVPDPDLDPDLNPDTEPGACSFFKFRTVNIGANTSNINNFQLSAPALNGLVPTNIITKIESEIEAGRQFCRDKAIALIATGKPGNITEGQQSFNPDGNNGQGKENFKFDNCVARYFGISGKNNSDTNFNRDENGNLVSNGQVFTTCTLVSFLNPSVCMPGYALLDVAYYFDIDGNVIQAKDIPKGVSRCNVGTYKWSDSPISLLWTPEADVDTQITITKFPVNPTLNGNFFLWKASAVTPLLVYDPEHTGIITSAEQLFGNWTFGGKKTAALSYDLELHNSPSLWRDGYEALGSLDANFDNKVSGEELSPLALWFDNNQDGISQDGEVKTLSEIGVSNLFYHSDRTEEATKNIIATRGFEREVNGQVITGSSVDWHSSHALTKEELITSLYLRKAFERSGVNDTRLETTIKTPAAESASAPAQDTLSDNTKSEAIDLDSRENVSGFWRWNTEESRNSADVPPLGGYLSFSDEDNGKITGHSYGIYDFPYAEENVKGMMRISNLSGQKTKDSLGNFILTFELATQEGTIVKSEATLIKGGAQLLGKTSATIIENGKPITITYRWDAKRA